MKKIIKRKLKGYACILTKQDLEDVLRGEYIYKKPITKCYKKVELNIILKIK